MKITRIIGILFILAGLLVVGSKLNFLPFQLPFDFLNGSSATVQGGLAMPCNVDKVFMELDIDAADIKMGATDGDKLIDYQTNVPDFKANQKDSSHIQLKTDKHLKASKGQFFNGNLQKTTVWDLTINMAALDGKLDFQQLQVDALTMNIASGDVTILSADDDRTLNITVNAAAADLVVYVPKSKGVKVISSSIASDISFDGVGFEKTGNTWASDGASDAKSMVVVQMNTAASDVKIMMQ